MTRRAFLPFVLLAVFCVLSSGSGTIADSGPAFGSYRYIDLANGADGEAFDINERGLVVGEVVWKEPDSEGPVSHAVVWAPPYAHSIQPLTVLPDLPGGEGATARGVNNRGHVVGWAFDANRSPRAVLWKDDAVQDLGTLGGARSWAHAINDRGHIVGEAQDAEGNVRACIWKNGQARSLFPESVPPVLSAAYDINDRGQVVGWYARNRRDVGLLATGFRWDRGRITNYGGGSSVWMAYGINERGDVVGKGIGDDSSWGFYARHDARDATNTVGSGWSSATFIGDVNDRSIAVGGMEDLRAFMLRRGQEIPLDGLLRVEDPRRPMRANAINNRGAIVGRGREPDNSHEQGQPFVMVPDPGRRERR